MRGTSFVREWTVCGMVLQIFACAFAWLVLGMAVEVLGD